MMQFPSGNLFRTTPYPVPPSLQRDNVMLSNNVALSHSGVLGNSVVLGEGVKETQQTRLLSANALLPVTATLAIGEKVEEARAQVGVLPGGPHDIETRSVTPFQLSERLDAKLEYDKHTQSSDYAISSYLRCEYAAKRDAISQMVGIDTYA